MSRFVELPNENLNIETISVNQTKLNLDIDYFINNDVILISSGTATGKTRNIGKLSKQLKDKYNCKILSIVNLITLSREQIATFKEESGIILKDYQKNLSEFGTCDGVICINSLYKLLEIENYDMENTILYIDEVNDLIRTLTHNDSLDKVLNLVYTTLIKLIKNSKKIILSDATINQNTLNLISSRIKNNKTILIKNTNKKFDGIEAIKINDENEFIQELRNHITNKKYFLFGCDICKTLTTFFNTLINEFPEQKEDFILITSETNFRPTNASKDFKDKYVFYSPSITTGVSFVLENVKQTQFIYISDKCLITPISIYQMACRTRNMDKLIYHCRDIKARELFYKSLNEVETKFKNLIKINEKLLSLSKSITQDDEMKIVENTFFKLFCYNEFQDNIFYTGFLKHFENIISSNGFTLREIGTYKKHDKEEQKEFKEIYDNIKEEQFNAFIKTKFSPIQTEEDLKIFEEAQRQESILNNRIDLLNITTQDIAEKYKVFITDENALTNYFCSLNLFRTDEYIKSKTNDKLKESFKIKHLSTIYNKLSILKEFESYYKINRLDLDFSKVDATKEINEDFQLLSKSVFEPRGKVLPSYKTKYDLLKIYVNMIKIICGDIPLILSKKCKKDKKGYYEYSLDNALIKDLIELVKFNNPQLKKFNCELIKNITGISPDPKVNLQMIDEDELINTYLFNKKNFKK